MLITGRHCYLVYKQAMPDSLDCNFLTQLIDCLSSCQASATKLSLNKNKLWDWGKQSLDWSNLAMPEGRFLCDDWETAWLEPKEQWRFEVDSRGGTQSATSMLSFCLPRAVWHLMTSLIIHNSEVKSKRQLSTFSFLLAGRFSVTAEPNFLQINFGF